MNYLIFIKLNRLTNYCFIVQIYRKSIKYFVNLVDLTC